MSYTELFAVPKGASVFESIGEFKNSHGSAPMVWDALALKYKIWEVDAKGERDTWARTPGPGWLYSEGWQRLWKYAALGCSLRAYEYNVLVSTYDNVVIPRSGLLSLATSMEMFANAHAVPFRVCSLNDQAQVLYRAASEGVRCVAWNQTSVCEFWGDIHAREVADSVDDYPAYSIDTMDHHHVSGMLSLTEWAHGWYRGELKGQLLAAKIPE